MKLIARCYDNAHECHEHGHMLLQYGNSSLHLASRKGHAELCKLLLGAKADVEAKDKVRS